MLVCAIKNRVVAESQTSAQQPCNLESLKEGWRLRRRLARTGGRLRITELHSWTLSRCYFNFTPFGCY